MDTLKMCSPQVCTVSGPAYFISHNSGTTEREAWLMREQGLGDRTRLTSRKHIKAAIILQMDGIRTGLHLCLSMCLGAT